MPWLSGTYSLPTNTWYPAVSNVLMSSSDSNAVLADIATALNNTIALDGSNAWTGNLKAGAHKITGLAAGTANGDSVRYEQVIGVYQPLLGYTPLNAASNLNDVASASAARTNLGLGSMATQAASSVAITGGTMSGVTITGYAALAGATFTGEVVLPTALPTSVNAAGFRGAPLGNGGAYVTGNYTIVGADAGTTLGHFSATPHTITIPANATVAFPVGTTIIIDNAVGGSNGAITVAITTDTLRRADGVAGTGSRTVPNNAVAVIRKTVATEWSITGVFT